MKSGKKASEGGDDGSHDAELKLIVEEFPHVKDNYLRTIEYYKGLYLVYMGKNHELKWTHYQDSKDGKDFDANRRNNLISQITWMEHQPSMQYFNENIRINIINMLGRCISLALNDQYDVAEKFIANAEKFINDRKIEISRKWQLQYSMLISAGVMAILLILHLFSGPISRMLNIDASIIGNSKYLLFSTIGVLLSLILNTGKNTYNCDTGKALNFIEILSRVTAGIISGIIVSILFNLDLIFTSLKDNGDPYYILCFLFIIAGFSERLVPSILQKITAQEIEPKEKDDGGSREAEEAKKQP
jgi:hypothetical protein